MDYNLPERFNLEYIGEKGDKHRPIMIHRAPFGSLERLIGILIEEYVGDFPLWLSPVQVRILPVSDLYLDYAKDVMQTMLMSKIRAEVDTSGERLGKMIRKGEKEKIPVMAIIGSKEMETNSLNIRTRKSGELGLMPINDFMKSILETISNHNDF